MTAQSRDHGGGIDAARVRFGGERGDWLDLSTGINPVPFPVPTMPVDAWTALPDGAATQALNVAARRVWSVPDGAAILAVPGTSAAIARIPALATAGTVHIPGPTYNEHAHAFSAHGWRLGTDQATACVVVHPNNPDGRLWPDAPDAPLTVIDESFCDLCPDQTLISRASPPRHAGTEVAGQVLGPCGPASWLCHR
jgi:cobalamin biosynthesis protein CobC